MPGVTHNRRRLRSSSAWPYLIAVGAPVGAVLLSALLMPWTDLPSYAPLLAAVAIAVSLGGLLPGFVSVVVGWAGAFFFLEEPRYRFEVASGDELVRWLVPLAFALIVVAVIWGLHRAQAAAEARVEVAERSRSLTAAVQSLTSALSSAVSASDVAQALVDRVPVLVGAAGASLGVIEGDDLEIVDPGGASLQILAPGLRLPLSTCAPITTAARTNAPAAATNRADFERDFPDGARLAPHSEGALAVPLRMGDKAIGALGLPFSPGASIDADTVAFVQLAADLGGQALERARLYDEEHQSRERLDRVVQLAPLFAAESPADLAKAICREARATFGSDTAQIWTGAGESLEVTWREPPSNVIPPGTRIEITDFPGLRETMDRLEVMFVPDAQESVRGLALEHARAVGVHSSLRVPIAIDGEVGRILTLQWERRVPAPPTSITVLARRFADQAGLALEQSARRIAQEAAARNAAETRRLLDVTAALAAAMTPSDVARATLREASGSLRADAGVFVRVTDDNGLEVIESCRSRDPAGDDHEVEGDMAPLADAVRTNELVVLTSPGERARRYPNTAPASAASFSIPLAAGGRVVGGIGLVFATERAFTDAELDFGFALSRQAGQALERALLFEAEHAARTRAERMAGDLVQLHVLATSLGRAFSAKDVAELVGAQVLSTVDASGVGVYVLDADQDELHLLDPAGALATRLLEESARVPLSATLPISDAIRSGSSVWLADDSDWSPYPESAGWRAAGVEVAGVVPLTVEERSVGALLVVFSRAPVDAEARRFVETVARQAAQPLERVRLLEIERASRLEAERANRRTRRLQIVTEGLASAATPEDVADVILREGLGALAGDAGAVYLLDAGASALRLLASAGYPNDALTGWDVIPLALSAPVSDAVRGGHLLELRSTAEILERYPSFKATLPLTGDQAALVVALSVGGRSLGALYIGFHEERAFDDGDRAMAQTLARQCAQALDRARAYALEREAAERVRRLHAVTAVLSQSLTAHDVSVASLERAVEAIGASRGCVCLLTPDHAEVELVASLGYPSGALDDWTRFAVEADVPVAEAIRTAQPVWALADGDLERYPLLQALGEERVAALPLVGSRGVHGALLLSFSIATEISADDRDWLVTLAGQCAQALDRSRLYDEEAASRRRSDRLQTLTAALSGSLTPLDVAAVFLDEVSESLQADGAAIGIIDHERRTIQTAGLRGYGAGDDEDPWLDVPLSARVPTAEASQRAHPIYLSLAELRIDYAELSGPIERSGHQSFAFVPLLAAGKALAVTVLSWRDPIALSSQDQAFLETIASQGGQALDRAHSYETERVIAETLQRSVLPETLPSMEGVQVAARYLPGTAAVDVGGDWFDTIPLSNGCLGFVVGDVVGKGVPAAATMGQLRNGLRALALDSSDAGTTVTKLNRLMDGYSDAPFATLAYLTLDPQDLRATLVSAGHLPPLVVDPRGEVKLLDEARGLPLGVDSAATYSEARTTLEPGSIVVLYTDGLVERRDRPLDAGLALLVEAAADAPRDPEAFADLLLERLIGEGSRGDDVAVLVIALDHERLESLELELPADRSSLDVIRDGLREWLELAAIPAGDAHDIVLATWEACANAIEHPQQSRDGLVRLAASLSGDKVRVEVSDSGRWREVESRPDRGLGLRLIQSLMTSTEIEQAEEGTRVVMERLLSRERASNHAAQ